MKTQIENLLKEVLPESAFIYVQDYNQFYGGASLRIAFSASDVNINNVKEQKPQLVSLSLNLESLELQTQVFCGNGGQSIYRDINKEDPNEKYLAMKSVRIPFRKPKPVEKNVLAAIKKFAENWIKVLRENKEVLRYQDLVNYDELLK